MESMDGIPYEQLLSGNTSVSINSVYEDGTIGDKVFSEHICGQQMHYAELGPRSDISGLESTLLTFNDSPGHDYDSSEVLKKFRFFQDGGDSPVLSGTHSLASLPENAEVVMGSDGLPQMDPQMKLVRGFMAENFGHDVTPESAESLIGDYYAIDEGGAEVVVQSDSHAVQTYIPARPNRTSSAVKRIILLLCLGIVGTGCWYGNKLYTQEYGHPFYTRSGGMTL
eukprot:132686_1